FSLHSHCSLANLKEGEEVRVCKYTPSKKRHAKQRSALRRSNGHWKKDSSKVLNSQIGNGESLKAPLRKRCMRELTCGDCPNGRGRKKDRCLLVSSGSW